MESICQEWQVLFCARSAPGIFEPFFMRFMGKLHIPQELRIRSRGTERHSASN
jgi:hypothetical protein